MNSLAFQVVILSGKNIRVNIISIFLLTYIYFIIVRFFSHDVENREYSNKK